VARHIFEPSVFYNAIGAAEPVLVVAAGDTIVAATVDARGFDRHDSPVASRPNPMTGPFFVSGAGPGDTLSVQIDRMTPSRGTGWTCTPLAPNVVDPSAVAAMPEREQCFWVIDRQNGIARLVDPPRRLADWTVPLAPMIGCFGVAPAAGQAISTATSGPFGGNMDYRLFGPGATAYFPVSVSGALFYLGDGHACQGDGEIVGTGIETSFEIEFTLRVLKGKTINWPRGETADDIFTIGNARPLDQALQHATTEMVAWLASDYGLDLVEASHLLGQTVRYDVANVYNPAYSVACRLSKSVLQGFGEPR
jgi:amidase